MLLRLCALLTTLLPLLAWAECKRAIEAPMSPIGLSAYVGADGKLTGVYPDLLARVTQQGGCVFKVTEVPRARQESLFENGKADILIPASYSPRRDRHGEFVPLIGRRATLISLIGERKGIDSVKELLARSELRVALVRGYDFGQAYQDLIVELTRQNRVVYDRDPVAVARMLQGGIADVTVMTPSILIGALLADKKNAALVDSLRVETLEEMPWDDSGVYLSLTTLTPAERDVLREQFERAARSGTVWKSFQYYYPPKALNGSIKPR